MMKNNELFNYINPKNNDILSKMNGKELQDLIFYLDTYYLELRESLNLDKSVTFGIEIEYENANKEKITKELSNIKTVDWITKADGSLKNGGEINSPVLNDIPNSWNDLKKICLAIKKNAIIGPHSGGHIHIGTQVLGDKIESWLNFIKLWSVYENIIFRFSYGEYLTARPSILKYAFPVSKYFWCDYKSLMEEKEIEVRDIIKRISYERHQAVNLYNAYDASNINLNNTIEFRCPNGTLNPIIWQNNINFFVKLLLSSKNNEIDNDIINYRKNKLQNIKYNLYNEIYLSEALEFCDMIFSNNLDKLYFLRQYLKSYENSDLDLVKAKKFTK